ncbi:hypothetical protein AAHA92_08950 [Salvia divinorum]|uniref:F-box domain-containing protein n=1 Tax=Salvia divinorum TaxID=28513 RepID=A0ABD1HQP1_SALDI
MGSFDKLPDDIFKAIMCLITDAKDVAYSSCVSKKWHDVMVHRKCLEFSEKLFGKLLTGSTDSIIYNMVWSVHYLEKLAVGCMFSNYCLASLLCMCCTSLKKLEIRADILGDLDHPVKIDLIRGCLKLEYLRLSRLELNTPPKWIVFTSLKILETVGCVLE